LFNNFQAFIDDLAKLGVNLGFVVAVATLSDDSWALANEALVLVGPFHNLDIPRAIVHELTVLGRARIG
jgi:hypothetical protein